MLFNRDELSNLFATCVALWHGMYFILYAIIRLKKHAHIDWNKKFM